MRRTLFFLFHFISHPKFWMKNQIYSNPIRISSVLMQEKNDCFVRKEFRGLLQRWCVFFFFWCLQLLRLMFEDVDDSSRCYALNLFNWVPVFFYFVHNLAGCLLFAFFWWLRDAYNRLLDYFNNCFDS